MHYTIEIYKQDARTKSGERLSEKLDVDLLSPKDAVFFHYTQSYPARKGFRVEVHETYVTRTNMMGGGQYQERYDTPRYCSPSSDSYWSM